MLVVFLLFVALPAAVVVVDVAFEAYLSVLN